MLYNEFLWTDEHFALEIREANYDLLVESCYKSYSLQSWKFVENQSYGMQYSNYERE